VGDLVFYCYKKRPKSRIVTHVAIYIGGGCVIHANQKPKKVTIEKIDDYPGRLVNDKDFETIKEWLEEFYQEFPELVGDER
jgi:cell wall-associated NlpC family hydrolase